MQYIDLNIAPSKFQAESLQDALASLISNDVSTQFFLITIKQSKLNMMKIRKN